MKIRAKANGNILEVSKDEGQLLIDCGVYELVEEEAPPPPPAPDVEQVEAPRGRYRRRDLKADD